MIWQDAALALGGAIGAGVAVVHGLLVQKLMVRPIDALLQGAGKPSGTIRRLVPLLLHFSTIVWFAGGLALVCAAVAGFGRETRLVTGLFVGVTYLLGAAGNLWGTRGRHPGGLLMALAFALVAAGIAGI